MVGGASEPLYLPAEVHRPALLYYRSDFAASALHEAAHWCIAGNARRRQRDFGYLYQPPPRTAAQQCAFFASERRVQTLEWFFADAAGVDFYPSADNLSADPSDFHAQLVATRTELRLWLGRTRGARARRFLQVLRRR
jgi:elongation factor P hydroxylase